MFYCYFELDSKSTERGLKMKLYLILLSIFFLASPFNLSYEIKGPPEVFNTSQSPSEKEEPATIKQKVIKKLWEKLQSSGLNEATKKETQKTKKKKKVLQIPNPPQIQKKTAVIQSPNPKKPLLPSLLQIKKQLINLPAQSS